jgi:Xaa-Pro aminopeptidase
MLVAREDTVGLHRIASIVVGALLVCACGAAAQTAEEFQRRRQAVRDAMDPESVLILRGAEPASDVPFRQDANLYYLTGVSDAGTSLILYSPRRGIAGTATSATDAGQASAVARQPGAVRTEILFLQAPAADAASRRGGPAAAAPQTPLARPGFQAVRPASDFQQVFESALLSIAGTVYLDYPRPRSLSDPLSAEEQWVKAARDRGSPFALKPASPLLSALRPVKSADEIATLTVAAEITAAAEREAMRTAKPGMFEYQLQSIIEHVFRVNGADGPGFSSIIGSGANSCVLHWSTNSRKTAPGDVVVMDVGARYGMYTADITRTIPISGTFSKRQREVYEIVLRANEEAIAMVAPGVDMSTINAKVNDVLTTGLIALGLIKDKSGLRQYYTHGLSHSVGLQVHDLGGALTVGVLKPGMVITIEPGLYIPAESLGVRIEDDVVVTEAGHEVITASVPKAIVDVEKLMKEPGTDFSRYLVEKKQAAGSRR